MSASDKHTSSLHVTQHLMDHKASIHTDMHDRYPVERANELGNDVVQLLKETDGFQQQKHGYTPLDYAELFNFGEIRDQIEMKIDEQHDNAKNEESVALDIGSLRIGPDAVNSEDKDCKARNKESDIGSLHIGPDAVNSEDKDCNAKNEESVALDIGSLRIGPDAVNSEDKDCYAKNEESEFLTEKRSNILPSSNDISFDEFKNGARKTTFHIKNNEQQKKCFNQVCPQHQRNGHIRRFIITNGIEKEFRWEEAGFTIFVPSDSLPSNFKECSVEVTAYLNTNITLPPSSLLVSGVYEVILTPHIEKPNKPFDFGIRHCVNLKPNEEQQLSFVIARGEEPTQFEYLEGGTFYVDPNTGAKTGRIDVTSFCYFAIVYRCFTGIVNWIYRSIWALFTGSQDKPDIEYCGSLYYTDPEPKCRKVDIVFTKNLPLCIEVLKQEYSTPSCFDASVLFQETEVEVVLPTDIVGEGWKFVPSANPLKITKAEVDGYEQGRRVPRCCFEVQWTLNNAFKIHNQAVVLRGARKPNEIMVKCSFSGSRSSMQQLLSNHIGASIHRICVPRVAAHIPHDDTIGILLGISPLEMDEIRNRNLTPAQKREAMLIKWIDQKGTAATYEVLMDTLLAIGERGSAEEILKLL